MPEGTRPFRVLVTGSRSWTDEGVIHDALSGLHFKHGSPITLVHGACPRGADAIADYWAELRNSGEFTPVIVERHPADWDAPCGPVCRTSHRRRRDDGSSYCPMAGLVRNQRMVDLGADVALAFIVDNSRGTADLIRRAEKAGIPVRRYERTTSG
ncbi:DUF2493 domain-containing protein [Nonomuraea typhae]|uniref:DUF2493 domain-containing protein n=1 Tax=Nonomuraea typhae TaxID=2603600 RepID=A0ABW7YNF4_9ACTN